MHRTLALILFSLFFGIGSLAWCRPVAYIGTAGFSPDLGLLGHAFVLVGDSQAPDFLFNVFDYYVAKQDGSKVEPVELLAGEESLRLHVERLPFFDFRNLYSGKYDRTLRFYELSMDDKEVLQLFEDLKADVANPKFSESHQYDLWSKNCVTRILDLINHIVEPGKRVNWLSLQTPLAQWPKSRAEISNALLNRTPFNLSRILASHPLATGKVKVFERGTDILTRYLLAIERRVEKIGEICRINSEILKGLQAYFGLAARYPLKYSPLVPSRSLLRTCPQSANELKTILGVFLLMLGQEDVQDLREEVMQLSRTLGTREQGK